ncbi:acyltransferase [Mucilaginibacter sp.]|uniref:acyltransferase n=1 Tax=Mucilaginibacter sp. TaxID=1882438 RepID=UPI003D0AAA83
MVNNNHDKQKPRFFYFDVLRALAIVAVVVLHNSVDTIDNFGKVSNFDWLSAAVYNGLTRFCVPLFVLMSGSLLLNKNKESTVKELFSKRLPKLLIPLVVWSIVYIAFLHYSKLGFAHINIWDCLLQFYKGPVIFHFWFLYMMIGIYLIYPVINAFITSASQSVILYFIAAWFCISCGTAIIEMVTGTATGLELYGFMGYIGYFVMGYYLKNYSFTKQDTRIIYGLSVLAFITSVASIIIFYNYHIAHGNDLVESDFTPDIPFAIAGLFLFMKNFNFTDKATWLKTIITELSMESYGIYIVHVLVMQTLFNKMLLNIQCNNMAVIWVVPLKTVVIVGITYGIVKLLKQVPFLKQTI